MEVTAAGTRDGRTVRAERTRDAVVEALLALLDEGELSPTAERVAQRAGVSERSIFQHFGDREALFEAAGRRQYDRVVPALRPVDPALSLDERLDAFVEQRCRLFEQVKGVRRAALLKEHESESIAAWLIAARKANAIEVERVFAREIAAIPADERDTAFAAMVAAAAWTSFENLRIQQQLAPEEACAAMRTALAALIGS
jgi:TetR/AcrR family transcriptional regulator of autoinduction and epiphytic fitness